MAQAAGSGGPDAGPDPGPIAAPRLATGAGGSTYKRKIVNKWSFLKRGNGKGTETSLGATTLQKGSGRSILQLRACERSRLRWSLPSLDRFPLRQTLLLGHNAPVFVEKCPSRP